MMNNTETGATVVLSSTNHPPSKIGMPASDKFSRRKRIQSQPNRTLRRPTRSESESKSNPSRLRLRSASASDSSSQNQKRVTPRKGKVNISKSNPATPITSTKSENYSVILNCKTCEAPIICTSRSTVKACECGTLNIIVNGTIKSSKSSKSKSTRSNSNNTLKSQSTNIAKSKQQFSAVALKKRIHQLGRQDWKLRNYPNSPCVSINPDFRAKADTALNLLSKMKLRKGPGPKSRTQAQAPAAASPTRKPSTDNDADEESEEEETTEEESGSESSLSEIEDTDDEDVFEPTKTYPPPKHLNPSAYGRFRKDKRGRNRISPLAPSPTPRHGHGHGRRRQKSSESSTEESLPDLEYPVDKKWRIAAELEKQKAAAAATAGNTNTNTSGTSAASALPSSSSMGTICDSIIRTRRSPIPLNPTVGTGSGKNVSLGRPRSPRRSEDILSLSKSTTTKSEKDKNLRSLRSSDFQSQPSSSSTSSRFIGSSSTSTKPTLPSRRMSKSRSPQPHQRSPERHRDRSDAHSSSSQPQPKLGSPRSQGQDKSESDRSYSLRFSTEKKAKAKAKSTSRISMPSLTPSEPLPLPQFQTHPESETNTPPQPARRGRGRPRKIPRSTFTPQQRPTSEPRKKVERHNSTSSRRITMTHHQPKSSGEIRVLRHRRDTDPGHSLTLDSAASASLSAKPSGSDINKSSASVSVSRNPSLPMEKSENGPSATQHLRSRISRSDSNSPSKMRDALASRARQSKIIAKSRVLQSKRYASGWRGVADWKTDALRRSLNEGNKNVNVNLPRVVPNASPDATEGVPVRVPVKAKASTSTTSTSTSKLTRANSTSATTVPRCEICDMSFTRRFSLTKHLQTIQHQNRARKLGKPTHNDSHSQLQRLRFRNGNRTATITNLNLKSKSKSSSSLSSASASAAAPASSEELFQRYKNSKSGRGRGNGNRLLDGRNMNAGVGTTRALSLLPPLPPLRDIPEVMDVDVDVGGDSNSNSNLWNLDISNRKEHEKEGIIGLGLCRIKQEQFPQEDEAEADDTLEPEPEFPDMDENVGIKSEGWKSGKYMGKSKQFECDVCSEKFTKKSDFSSHLWNHRTGNTKDADADQDLSCETCGKMFSDSGEYNQHIDFAHLSDVKFPCKFCPSKFNRNDYLQKHLMAHRRDLFDRFMCTACDRRFTSHALLLRHFDLKHLLLKPKVGLSLDEEEFESGQNQQNQMIIALNTNATNRSLNQNQLNRPALALALTSAAEYNNNLNLSNFENRDPKRTKTENSEELDDMPDIDLELEVPVPGRRPSREEGFSGFISPEDYGREFPLENNYQNPRIGMGGLDTTSTRIGCGMKRRINPAPSYHFNPLACKDCGKLFENRKLLIKHVEYFNQAERHACLVCRKKFKWRYLLNRHMQRHTRQKERMLAIGKNSLCSRLKKSFLKASTTASGSGASTNTASTSMSMSSKELPKLLPIMAKRPNTNLSLSAQPPIHVYGQQKQVYSNPGALKLKSYPPRPSATATSTITGKSSGSGMSIMKIATMPSPFSLYSSTSSSLKSRPISFGTTGTASATATRPSTYLQRTLTPTSTLVSTSTAVRTSTGSIPTSAASMSIVSRIDSKSKPTAGVGAGALASQTSHSQLNTCDICYKSFTDKKTLSVHLYFHRGTNLFTCPDCEAKCERKSDFELHYKCHETNQPFFLCYVCFKPFRWKKDMIRHVRRKHPEEKTYRCLYCTDRFKTNEELSEHISLDHSEHRSFPCEYCGRRYAQRRYLVVHIQTQHEIEAGITDGSSMEMEPPEGYFEEDSSASEVDISSFLVTEHNM